MRTFFQSLYVIFLSLTKRYNIIYEKKKRKRKEKKGWYEEASKWVSSIHHFPGLKKKEAVRKVWYEYKKWHTSGQSRNPYCDPRAPHSESFCHFSSPILTRSLTATCTFLHPTKNKKSELRYSCSSFFFDPSEQSQNVGLITCKFSSDA